MLGHNHLDFIRYFYCTCLTRPPDFLSGFRNLAGATQRIQIDKIESQVVPTEEAGTESKNQCCFSTMNGFPRGVHKHFFDRDARPRTNFNYP